MNSRCSDGVRKTASNLQDQPRGDDKKTMAGNHRFFFSVLLRVKKCSKVATCHVVLCFNLKP